MRCLYCGNELALLKKLTGGGEFCSEAHRQNYQDEYNRLALSRLLQTPSRTGDGPDRGQANTARAGKGETPASPQAKSVAASALPSAVPENPAPPAAGFMKSGPPPVTAPNENPPPGANGVPIPGSAGVSQKHYGSEPFTQEAGVSMPVWPIEGGKVALATAQVVTLKLNERRWDSSPRRKEKPLEGRDFSRSIPAVEPHLDVIEGRGLSLIKEPIEILAAHVAPPQPKLWHGASLVFSVEPQFAETSRLEFRVARDESDEARQSQPRRPAAETAAEGVKAVEESDIPRPAEVPVVAVESALVAEAVSPEPAAVAPLNGTTPEREAPVAATEPVVAAVAAVEPVVTETFVAESIMEATESPVEPRPAPSLADLWRRSFFEESVALPQPEAAKGSGTQAAIQSEALPVNPSAEPEASQESHESTTAVASEPAAADPVSAEPPPPQALAEAAASASVSPRGALMDLARLQQGITAPAPRAELVPTEPVPTEAPPLEAVVEAVVEPEPVPAEASAPQKADDRTEAPDRDRIHSQNGNEAVSPCPSVPASQRGIAPGKGKLVQSFQAISVTTFRLNLPRVGSLPMRPKITIGPASAESKFKLKTAEQKPADPKAAPPASETDKEIPIKVTTRSERLFPGRPEAAAGRLVDAKPPESKQDAAKTADSQPFDSKPVESKAVDNKVADNRAGESKTTDVKIADKAIEKKAENKPQPPKTADKKPDGAESPEAVKKDSKTPPGAPKANDGQADLDRLREAAVAALDGPRLSLESSDIGSPIGSFWRRLSPMVKAAVLLVAVAAVAAAIWLMKDSSITKAGAPAAGEGAGPGIMMGEGGWSTDWAGDAAGSHRGRQIQIYRPSLNMSDYRMEFQGTIESKSIGWVFRASNPRNYYAMKLEVVKPGLSPTVVLVKFAVVDGEDSPREQVPLPMPVRLDTVYKVRLEARGPRFTTTVQDQVVDTWTDERLKTGGVGFFSDRGERPQIRGVQISVLNGGQ